MAKLNKSFEDYTESEFVEFVEGIFSVSSASEAEMRSWLAHFREVTEYPGGTDILFYPLPGADCSPAGVVSAVRQWRAENGKPGFKTEFSEPS